jgi:hypothetical protein
MTKKLLFGTALGLLILPLAASADTSVATPAVAGTTTVKLSTADLFTACSQAAIDTRDGAIGGARAAYNNQMAIALDVRKNAEKAAVAITDESAKKTAIKAAADAYKAAFTQAQEMLVKARKDAWNQFEENVNACRNPQEATSNSQAAHALSPQKATTVAAEKSLKDVLLEKLKSLFSN